MFEDLIQRNPRLAQQLLEFCGGDVARTRRLYLRIAAEARAELDKECGATEAAAKAAVQKERTSIAIGLAFGGKGGVA